MKAQDLRVGNLVTDEWYDSFKTIITVDSINKKGIDLFIEDDGNYPECAKTWIEPEYRFDQLRGIQLTEEWINKTGFSVTEFKEICGLTIKNRGGKFFLCSDYISREFEIMVEYVHRLQNLFFEITDEELTIKETV